MDLRKNDYFLLNIANNRFRQTLKEFAENDGIDSQFVERVVDRYLANPGALGSILADYPNRQDELRVRCLLRAGKEVHREITQHFESTHKENRKALIHEMPTDKYLRLKLQVEYILRYVREIDEEELSKLKEAGVLRDKLLEAIRQAEQLRSDQEEINQQIQELVKVEVDSRLIEINQLRHEMESQQNEIKQAGDLAKALQTNTVSIDELQSVKDILQQDRRHSNEMFKNLNEQLRSKPSRPEIDDIRSRLADHRDAISEWSRQQNIFSDQLKSLETREGDIAASAMSFHEDVEQIVRTLMAEAKEDLRKSVQAQLGIAKKEADEQFELIKQEVTRLGSRIDNSTSENKWTIDEVNRLIEEKLQNLSVPSEQLHSVIESIDNLKADVERLSAQNGHDPKAHERIEELMTTLASLEEKFPGLEQKIASLLPEDLAKAMAGEWEKVQSERLERWLLYSLGRINKAREKIAKAQLAKSSLEDTCKQLQTDTRDPSSKEFIELVRFLWPSPKPRKKLLERLGI